MAEVLRIRRPVDVYELAWRMAEQVKPVLDARSGVLASGSPEAVVSAEEVVAAAVDYLQAATSITPAQGRWMGILQWRPSREQEAELGTQLDRAAKAVQAFVTVMRSELGERETPVDAHDEFVANLWPTQNP